MPEDRLGASGDTTTIGSRLRATRARRFVGRTAELDLFERALDEPGGPFSVLFVHGPPGVGKSALLRELAGRAEARGRRVDRLDLREVETTPHGVLSRLLPGTDASEPTAADLQHVDVLVLDTYELAAPLDGWVREQLIPALPADALVVIAGRNAPSPEWAADPGWRPLLRVVGLRNLRRADAAKLLANEGIDPQRHGGILGETFGHPLALCLYADLLAQRGAGEGDTPPEHGLLDAPDVVYALLGRFVDEIPGPRHRSALELCAHVRFTTEELITVATEAPKAEAADLFDWLRGLSFVETSPEGLFPHDLARDILDTDLRWRDPAGYDALHMRVRRHLVDRVRSTTGPDRDRAATDLVFLHRANPLMRQFFDFSRLPPGYLDRLRPDDVPALRAMVHRHEGAASAAILDHWIERQPDAFAIIRLGADPAPQGFTALLALHEATADDFAADPGARAMWAHVQRHGSCAPGQVTVACRFIVDRDAHQTPGTLTLGLSAVAHLQRILTQGERAMDFIGGIARPEQLAPVFDYIDFPLTSEAGYELDGRPWGVFVRDWRGQDVDEWFEMIAGRELGAPVEPSPSAGGAATVALSQPDFAEAVRRALRDLHRPDRLRQNPLVGSRLVRDLDEPDRAAALASAIRSTVDGLGADPRTEKFQWAVERTYVRPAPSQERAAEVLGLPFSTYRRHLTRGIESVVSTLWDQELYGPATTRDEQELSSERSGG